MDSLLRVIKSTAHDTDVAESYVNLGGRLFLNSQKDSALACFQRALKFIEGHMSTGAGMGRSDTALLVYQTAAFTWLASIAEKQNDPSLTIHYSKQALASALKVNEKTGILQAYNRVGVAYLRIGDMVRAVEYLSQGLRLSEQMGNKRQIASATNNLAAIFINQGENQKAIELYQKCIRLDLEMGDSIAVASVYGSIAVAYVNMNKLEEAEKLLRQSLTILLRKGDKPRTAKCYSTLGATLFKADKTGEALEMFRNSISIYEGLNDLDGLSYTHCKLAEILLKQNNTPEAEKFARKSEMYSKKLNFLMPVLNSDLVLYKILKQKGNFKEALSYYEHYILLRDSSNNESTRKASIRSQLKYEYEKQAAADSVAHAKENEVKSAELSRQSAELRAKKNQQYALFGGLGLVIIFAGFMYNRFKVTQKQKMIIEEQKIHVEDQKKLVEEKQREILDSIAYARKIQMAQIPSEKRVEKMLLGHRSQAK